MRRDENFKNQKQKECVRRIHPLIAHIILTLDYFRLVNPFGIFVLNFKTQKTKQNHRHVTDIFQKRCVSATDSLVSPEIFSTQSTKYTLEYGLVRTYK